MAPHPLPTRPRRTGHGSFSGRASAPGGGPAPLAPGGTAKKRSPHPAPPPEAAEGALANQSTHRVGEGPLPPEHPPKEAAQQVRRTPHAATNGAGAADRSTSPAYGGPAEPPAVTGLQAPKLPTSQPTKWATGRSRPNTPRRKQLSRCVEPVTLPPMKRKQQTGRLVRHTRPCYVGPEHSLLDGCTQGM